MSLTNPALLGSRGVDGVCELLHVLRLDANGPGCQNKPEEPGQHASCRTLGLLGLLGLSGLLGFLERTRLVSQVLGAAPPAQTT